MPTSITLRRTHHAWRKSMSEKAVVLSHPCLVLDSPSKLTTNAEGMLSVKVLANVFAYLALLSSAEVTAAAVSAGSISPRSALQVQVPAQRDIGLTQGKTLALVDRKPETEEALKPREISLPVSGIRPGSMIESVGEDVGGSTQVKTHAEAAEAQTLPLSTCCSNFGAVRVTSSAFSLSLL